MHQTCGIKFPSGLSFTKEKTKRFDGRVRITVPRRRKKKATFMGATSPTDIVLVIFLCLLKEYFIVCTAKDCYAALGECNTDSKCSLKLNNYSQECGTIVDISNTIPNASRFPCSDGCVKSIKSLMRTKKGKDLWTCECNLDANCLTLKARTEKCLAIANGSYRQRTGCTVVMYRCMMDTKCNKAQMEFLLKCSKLFSLTACTKECLRSQKKLFSLEKGRPLMDCECDGLDETYCLGLRAHAEYMKCKIKARNICKKRRSRKRNRKRCRQRIGDKQNRKRKRRKD